jgi:hypothetical protein
MANGLGGGRDGIAAALLDMFDQQAPAIQSASLTPGPSISPSVPAEAPPSPTPQSVIDQSFGQLAPTGQAIVDQGFAPFGPNFDQTWADLNALDPVSGNVHGEAGVSPFGPGDPVGFGGFPGLEGSVIGGAGVTGQNPGFDLPAIDPESYSSYASAGPPGGYTSQSPDPYADPPTDPYGSHDPGYDPGVDPYGEEFDESGAGASGGADPGDDPGASGGAEPDDSGGYGDDPGDSPGDDPGDDGFDEDDEE